MSSSESVFTLSRPRVAPPISQTFGIVFVNALTLSRALLVVPLIIVLGTGDIFGAFCLAFLAAQLDWLDGYLSRRWGCVTRFGAFADPIADKIFFLGALIALYRAVALPLIVVILALELFLVAHRVWVLVRAHTADVSANLFGKIKAILQNGVICVLIADIYFGQLDLPRFHALLVIAAQCALYVSVAFAALSAFTHVRRHLRP